jgi:REP-associated tyrosine transposase
VLTNPISWRNWVSTVLTFYHKILDDLPYRINKSYSNCFYHIYNRGNNRNKIFFEEKNYFYFLGKISKNFKGAIDLIAFCLMPNHYHLLVKVNENGAIEMAMQKISTGFTRAINKSYGRTGHLFGGRYKNKLIPNDEYLVHLVRYIHLNPVRARLVGKMKDWKYSSYMDYLGKRNLNILDKAFLLNYFNSLESFIDFHNTFQIEQHYFVKYLLF